MHEKLAEHGVHLPNDWREAKTLEAMIDRVMDIEPGADAIETLIDYARSNPPPGA